MHCFRFGSLVSRLEKKPQCKGRSLELFLTYPMHQVRTIDLTNRTHKYESQFIVSSCISIIFTFDEIHFRFLATSSPCTSCWPTPRLTTWRRTPWSRPELSRIIQIDNIQLSTVNCMLCNNLTIRSFYKKKIIFGIQYYLVKFYYS